MYKAHQRFVTIIIKYNNSALSASTRDCDLDFLQLATVIFLQTKSKRLPSSKHYRKGLYNWNNLGNVVFLENWLNILPFELIIVILI